MSKNVHLDPNYVEGCIHALQSVLNQVVQGKIAQIPASDAVEELKREAKEKRPVAGDQSYHAGISDTLDAIYRGCQIPGRCGRHVRQRVYQRRVQRASADPAHVTAATAGDFGEL